MRTQPLCLDKPLTTGCLSPEGQQDCLTLVGFIPVTESCLTNEKHLEQFDNVICLHQERVCMPGLSHQYQLQHHVALHAGPYLLIVLWKRILTLDAYPAVCKDLWQNLTCLTIGWVYRGNVTWMEQPQPVLRYALIMFVITASLCKTMAHKLLVA